MTHSTTAPERDERDARVRDEEAQRVERVERREHRRRRRTMSTHAEHGRATTNQTTMTGPKSAPTPAGAVAAGQRTGTISTTEGDRHDVRLASRGVDDLQALDRAEHRDRRRDHAVAVEQRGAEDAEQRCSTRRSRAVVHRCVRRQRDQRQDAAFAVVVGAHDEQDVLERDDDRQRPEDQRQHAEHVALRRRGSACCAGEAPPCSA